MPPCEEHAHMKDCVAEIAKSIALLQKDIEYLRRDQETILCRFGKHVEDAEKNGGWHDRLKSMEDDVKFFKIQRANDMIVLRWFMIGSGVIGGMMGAGAPEAFLGIMRLAGIIK